MSDDTRIRHVLVGGSGAVGAVYGWFLSLSSRNDIYIFVRPKYAETIKQQGNSITLYDVNARLNSFIVLSLLTFLLFSFLYFLIFYSLSLFNNTFIDIIISSMTSILTTALTSSAIQKITFIKQRTMANKHKFNKFTILTDVNQVAAVRPDYIWLCISSEALRNSSLLTDLSHAITSHTSSSSSSSSLSSSSKPPVLVSLTPGPLDNDFIRKNWLNNDGNKVVIQGLITEISWQCPLLTERSHIHSDHEPSSSLSSSSSESSSSESSSSSSLSSPRTGIAYFIPPGESALFSPLSMNNHNKNKNNNSGDSSSDNHAESGLALARLIHSFDNTSFRVKVSDGKDLVAIEAILHALLLGLELSEFRFASLLSSPSLLSLVVSSMVECSRVSCRHENIPIPFPIRYGLLNQTTLKLIITILPNIFVWDIETYLRFHFGLKERLQTCLIVSDYLVLNSSSPSPSSMLATSELLARVEKLRSSPS